MIHAFVLYVFLGLGDDKRAVSQDMIFRSLDDCSYFARNITRVYGSYEYHQPGSPKITAYCLPVYISADKVPY